MNKLKQVRIKTHLVPRHGIQEWGDPFVKKAQEERKIRDNSSSQRFHVMLLQDRKYLANINDLCQKLTESGPGSAAYLARYGYRWIGAEGGRFVIDNDNKGLLTCWHHILGTFSLPQFQD